MDTNIFWYYAGNRVEHLMVNGIPTLVAPHTYFLAPSNQPIPAYAKNLFRQKNPPAEIAAKFGVAVKIAEVRTQTIEQETAKALEEQAAAKAIREQEARDKKRTEPLPLPQAIREFVKDTDSESSGEKPKSESRKERRDREERERKEREVPKDFPHDSD